MIDNAAPNDTIHAHHATSGACSDSAGSARGRYTFRCYDSKGNLKWTDHIDNTVMTLGKDAILTAALKGVSYTAAVYIGLISAIGFVSAPVAADTMLSHATWREAGGANAPTFAARVPATFGTASGGSLGTATSSNFTMAGAGTIKGAFVCFNGATTTIDSTIGTLYAAGLFPEDKVVSLNDVIQVSYTTSLT